MGLITNLLNKVGLGKLYSERIYAPLQIIFGNKRLVVRRLPADSYDNIYDGEEYEIIQTSATYAPWRKDKSFQTTYSQIKNDTLVDEYRCFEIWQLVEQSAKLPEGALIEVGVWRGGTGALIAKAALQSGISSSVYLCDTFSGVVKAGIKDSIYKGGEHGDTSREIVEQLITKAELNNVTILEGIFPEQTSHEIKDTKFRFCHIDVDVYQSAKEIVEWIWDKMVQGGIFVYDDYGSYSCDGIAKYIEEQIPLNDRLVVYNLNGHGIIIKL